MADVEVEFSLAQPEGGSNVPKRNHQSHRLIGTWIKAERDVEVSRFLGNGVDNDPSYSNRVGSMGNAAGRISKQRAS
jgi:hypothetical protein